VLSYSFFQVEYFSYGVEDFALYLPMDLVPSRRVLVLRYKNRFEALVQSLVMRGVGNAVYLSALLCTQMTLFR
jgi:uroporphyrinogen-III synthase